MHHSMRLNPAPFERMKKGSKEVEIRLNDIKRRLIKVGDTITFTSLSDKAETLSLKVIALHRFKTFRELVEVIPMSKFGYPEDKSRTDFTESIYTIYNKDEEQKYGVLGIELELI